jgi:hypothetical protein
MFFLHIWACFCLRDKDTDRDTDIDRDTDRDREMGMDTNRDNLNAEKLHKKCTDQETVLRTNVIACLYMHCKE